MGEGEGCVVAGVLLQSSQAEEGLWHRRRRVCCIGGGGSVAQAEEGLWHRRRRVCGTGGGGSGTGGLTAHARTRLGHPCRHVQPTTSIGKKGKRV